MTPATALRRKAEHLRALADEIEAILEVMEHGPADRLLTAAEAASELHMSANQVYELIASGELAAIDIGKVPGRFTGKRVERAALDEFKRRRSTARAACARNPSTAGEAHRTG